MSRVGRGLGTWLLAVLVSALALQLFFASRIALMRVVDPQSTSFQRSEAWRLLTEKHRIDWSQTWVGAEQISPQLKRAVIASEDDGFVDHHGVDWDAIKKAWQRNEKSGVQVAPLAASQAAPNGKKRAPKVVGGSTISQQLAKNLFLSGERTLLRKAQEFVITVLLEALLDKDRILTIYLNSVEWGEGVFGAQAAARHYFQVDAGKLSPMAAALQKLMDAEEPTE